MGSPKMGRRLSDESIGKSSELPGGTTGTVVFTPSPAASMDTYRRSHGSGTAIVQEGPADMYYLESSLPPRDTPLSPSAELPHVSAVDVPAVRPSPRAPSRRFSSGFASPRRQTPPAIMDTPNGAVAVQQGRTPNDLGTLKRRLAAVKGRKETAYGMPPVFTYPLPTSLKSVVFDVRTRIKQAVRKDMRGCDVELHQSLGSTDTHHTFLHMAIFRHRCALLFCDSAHSPCRHRCPAPSRPSTGGRNRGFVLGGSHAFGIVVAAALDAVGFSFNHRSCCS